MKFIIASALTLISTAVFAAGSTQSPIMLRMEITPGFERPPLRRAITVDNNGLVISTILGQSDDVRSKELATLSSASMKTLRAEIDAIKKTAKLEDQNPDQSECVDAPSARVVVNKGMFTEKEIYRRSKCHDYSVDGSDKLVRIIKGLNSLAD